MRLLVPLLRFTGALTPFFTVSGFSLILHRAELLRWPRSTPMTSASGTGSKAPDRKSRISRTDFFCPTSVGISPALGTRRMAAMSAARAGSTCGWPAWPPRPPPPRPGIDGAPPTSSGIIRAAFSSRSDAAGSAKRVFSCSALSLANAPTSAWSAAARWSSEATSGARRLLRFRGCRHQDARRLDGLPSRCPPGGGPPLRASL